MELLLKNACSVPFGYVQGAGRLNYCLKIRQNIVADV